MDTFNQKYVHTNIVNANKIVQTNAIYYYRAMTTKNNIPIVTRGYQINILIYLASAHRHVASIRTKWHLKFHQKHMGGMLQSSSTRGMETRCISPKKYRVK